MIISNTSLAQMRKGDPKRSNDVLEATTAAFHADGRHSQK